MSLGFGTDRRGPSRDLPRTPTLTAPASYALVHALREEAHPDSGHPARVAYVAGHCDAMAAALQREMGGELVMLLDPSDHSGMVHVGVHRDGTVSDADGHFGIGEWVDAWSALYSPDATLDVVRATPAAIEDIMNHNSMFEEDRLLDDRRVSLAMPLARALADAADLDPRAWRIATTRSIPKAHELPADADEAWTAALALPAKPGPRPVEIGPTPSRDDIHWGSIPLDERVVNERGRTIRRPAPEGGIVAAAKRLERTDPRPTVSKGPRAAPEPNPAVGAGRDR